MSVLSDQHAARDRELNHVRNYGPTDAPEDRTTDTEHKRRERRKQAAAVIAAKPVAAAGSPAAAVVPPPAPPKPPTVIDRLHKRWLAKGGGIIWLGQDHDATIDSDQMPPLNPGYAKSGHASSIADAYALAVQWITTGAVQPKARVVIAIMGGRWTEQLVFTTDRVDLVGIGNPTIVGNQEIAPTLFDAYFEGITFETVNGFLAMWLPSAPIMPSPIISLRPEFKQCTFIGPQKAFYAQRRFYAEECRFEQTQVQDVASEIAPCWIEMEMGPQVWFTFLRRCEFYVVLQKEANQPGYPAPQTPVSAMNFAIRVSALLEGLGPYQQTLLSNDGIFRASVDPTTGIGVIGSGVVLDDCHVYGRALVEGWTLIHLHGTQYGPQPSGGASYCRVRGHDWLSGGGFDGRQFGIVIFDESITHARIIAEIVRDPLTTNEAFPGGGAVFYRVSDHLQHAVVTGGAAVLSTTAVGYLYPPGSYTGMTVWTGGAIIPVGTDVGSHVNVPAPAMWNPLFP